MTGSEYQTVTTCLSRFRQGDRDAFAEIFSLYQQKVFFICCKLLSSKSSAAKITAELFDQAYLRLQSFSGARDFERWLYITSISRCRKQLMEVAPETFGDYIDSDSPEGANAEDHIRRDLDAATRTAPMNIDVAVMERVDAILTSLPLKLRIAVILKYFCGADANAIAACENISRAAALNRLHKARIRLMTEEHKFTQLGEPISGMVMFLPQILTTMADSIVVPDSVSAAVTEATGVFCMPAGGVQPPQPRPTTRQVTAYATGEPQDKAGMTVGMKVLVSIVAVLIIAAAVIAVVFAVKGGFGGGSVSTTVVPGTTGTTVEITTQKATEISTHTTTATTTETTTETTTTTTTMPTTEPPTQPPVTDPPTQALTTETPTTAPLPDDPGPQDDNPDDGQQ